MRIPKSVPLGSAALVVFLVGAGIPDTGIAEPEVFTITCEETGDGPQGNPFPYLCKMLPGKGPGKPEHEKVPFPKGEEFLIDMDKLMLFPPLKESDKPRACPGWFFINGKWRYFSPPCPWRSVNKVEGNNATKK